MLDSLTCTHMLPRSYGAGRNLHHPKKGCGLVLHCAVQREGHRKEDLLSSDGVQPAVVQEL